MKLSELHKEIVKIGISADPRSKKEINRKLKKNDEKYRKLNKEDKELFDRETLWNPFSDSRIAYGNPNEKIKKIMVGIDIDTAELLLADTLNKKGANIDLVLAHHPTGEALSSFYEVMDLQSDIFNQKGISMGAAEQLLYARKAEISRKVSAANFSKAQDAAKLLGLSFMNAHTPADNLAYRTLESEVKNKRPVTLQALIDTLMGIPEYRDSASRGCPPQILHGTPGARVKNIHYEFTGGTEGPIEIYKRLSQSGVDTIVAMHLSERHFQAAKEAHLNIVMAGHISSDTVGLNALLDKLQKKFTFEVVECSGFRRIKRKK